ncbi:MAG: YlxR family protein [Thermoleophilia bacterium]|nr:YlxR family protein [Thermoleophilia bacterium]
MSVPRTSSRSTATSSKAAKVEPTRTCAGCGQQRPQSQLVRLSVAAAGLLVVGGSSGRGTYLCASTECVEQAVRTRAIPRRLRASLEVPIDLAERVLAALAGGEKPPDW